MDSRRRLLAVAVSAVVVLWQAELRTGAKLEAAVSASVTIDASKTGESISPYIYGQFIEHLGRCIYGGIWAEMLEDRKFYYPVPADGPIWKEHKGAKVLAGSPWQVIGPASSVKMVTEGVYVGQHCPRVQLPGGVRCGIYQQGLGLVGGKHYTGRVILAGEPGCGPIEVSLVWGEGAGDRETVTIKKIRPEFQKFPLSFRAGASTDNGRLEIVGCGTGGFRIGTVSLMPADNVAGMRADTLKLLKELNATIYRWPGGNFVSGYDWRDGIGERDRRPPRRNPAWTGIEHNDFGLDEFIAFCREVNAEPLIVVNSGFGDAHSAAEEVEYANGPVDTPMGRLRARNGHPEPYGVKWWGIGNEMYGEWQLGHMSIGHYVIKHNLFAKAMRRVDPSIKLIAVGEAKRWSEGMLRNCSDYMDLISEHFYRSYGDSILDHVQQMSKTVLSLVRPHRKWRKELDCLKGKDIRIAIDEWNYWHRPYVYEYGELGCRYTLKDALGVAVTLHEMIRNSDIIAMANYAQTVNVIGCIKTTKTDAAFATTALPLKLYRNRFGTVPVEVSGSFEPLDIVAALTKDRKAFTMAVVNPTEQKYRLTWDIEAVEPAGGGVLWQIAGTDPMAYNEPGKPPKVSIVRRSLPAGGSDVLEVPAISVCLYRIPIE